MILKNNTILFLMLSWIFFITFPPIVPHSLTGLLPQSRHSLKAQLRVHNGNWQTIQSRHFRLHFPSRLLDPAHDAQSVKDRQKQWAQTLASFESIYLQLAKSNFVHTTTAASTPTEIVLVDNTDLANGYATPFPFNKIELVLHPPQLQSNLHNYHQWLPDVFRHEFTHILNLDQSRAPHSWLRTVLGKVTFPNTFSPLWALEGNAVYQESRISGQWGRNHSSYVDMIMRTGFLTGTQASISEASLFVRRWPGGSIPYYYGGRFVQFLEKYYGPFFSNGSAFAMSFYNNSNNVFPFLSNKNARDTFQGKSFEDLWTIWQNEAKRYYQQKYGSIQQEKNGIKIVASGSRIPTFPSYTMLHSYLNFLYDNGRSPASLCQYRPNHNHTVNKSQIQCKMRINHPMDYSFQGQTLWLVDLQIHQSRLLSGDLFYLPDTTTHKMLTQNLLFAFKAKQKTKGKRIHSMDFDSKNQLWALVRYQNGYFYVTLSQGKKPTLTALSGRTHILRSLYTIGKVRFAPAPAKQTAELAVIARTSKNKNSLILFTLKRFPAKQPNWQVTRIRQIDIPAKNTTHPAWHPKQKNKILVSSDPKNIFNIFEIDISQKMARPLTNVVTGAFCPAISPDAKEIAFSYYRADGFALATMPYTGSAPVSKTESKTGSVPISAIPAISTKGSVPITVQEISAVSRPLHLGPVAANNKIQTDSTTRPGAYSPFPALWPKLFIPIVYSEQWIIGCLC